MGPSLGCLGNAEVLPPSRPEYLGDSGFGAERAVALHDPVNGALAKGFSVVCAFETSIRCNLYVRSKQ